MPDTDLRAQYEQRLDAILRSADGGDDTALARFDGLLVEMAASLGDTHPDALRAELVYVSIQESGRPWPGLTVRSLTPRLEVIATTFGDPSEELIHARFLALLQDAHQFVAMQSQVDDEMLASLTELERVEFDLATAVTRDHLTLQAQPVVAAIAHLLDVGPQREHLIECAGHWARAMATLDPHAALAALPHVAPESQEDEGFLTICQMLYVAAERAASMAAARDAVDGIAQDAQTAQARDAGIDDEPDEPVTFTDACRLLTQFAEVTDDDPEWDDFRAEHADALVLATLVDAGLALPTDEGATLIEQAFDAMAAQVQFAEE